MSPEQRTSSRTMTDNVVDGFIIGTIWGTALASTAFYVDQTKRLDRIEEKIDRLLEPTQIPNTNLEKVTPSELEQFQSPTE